MRTAYLSAARTDAQVVNYLARRITESQGKMPSLGLLLLARGNDHFFLRAASSAAFSCHRAPLRMFSSP